MATLPPDSRKLLNRFLQAHFSDITDLQDIAINLGIRTAELPASTVPELAHALIEYCEDRGMVSCLLVEVLQARQNQNLDGWRDLKGLLEQLGPCDPRRTVEVVVLTPPIEGNKREVLKRMVEEFEKSLAAVLAMSPEEEKLLAATTGSMRLLINLPERAAGRLLSGEVRELLGGKYRIVSVRRYMDLSPAERSAWRAATQAPSSIVVPSATVPGLVKFVLVLVVAGAAGAGVGLVAAPTLTIRNNCGMPIPLPAEVPIVGRAIPTGRSEYRVWPGDYTVTSSNGIMRVTGPLGIDTGPFAQTEQYAVSKDGEQVNLDHISVGPGSHVEVTFCPFRVP